MSSNTFSSSNNINSTTSARDTPASRKADQVYTRIREEIENGSLKPGQRLAESWLVEHTGASRTPVRDALRRLASDELVILEPRQAPMVSPLSIRHIRDLFSFRRVIEVAALEEIAQSSATSEEIRSVFDDLGQSFRKLEDQPDIDNFSEEFRTLTSKFDENVVAYSNNRFLEKAIVGLRPHTIRLRLIAHADQHRLQQSVREHIEMCEAVRAGDLRLAGSASRQHLFHVERSILNALVNSSSPHIQGIDFRD